MLTLIEIRDRDIKKKKERNCSEIAAFQVSQVLLTCGCYEERPVIRALT